MYTDHSLSFNQNTAENNLNARCDWPDSEREAIQQGELL